MAEYPKDIAVGDIVSNEHGTPFRVTGFYLARDNYIRAQVSPVISGNPADQNWPEPSVGIIDNG